MEKPKVLIVEDEAIIALDMKRAIERFDYEVTNTVINYNSAINSVRVNKPDIILMDINLKNSIDGIETVKKIQTIEKIPVIYVSSFSDEETIQRAIETNPVSYLTKPFKRDDLKSNIILGLYKKNNENEYYEKTNTNINLGLNYNYDYNKENLFYKKLPVKLSKKENLLLKMLIDADGQIVSFEEIKLKIWYQNDISSSTLRTLIYRLRSKLEHKLIKTSSMIGCRWNKNVE